MTFNTRDKRTWKVWLTEENGHTLFREGWPLFRDTYQVSYRELLYLSYDNNTSFEVSLFTLGGMEKIRPPSATKIKPSALPATAEVKSEATDLAGPGKTTDSSIAPNTGENDCLVKGEQIYTFYCPVKVNTVCHQLTSTLFSQSSPREKHYECLK